MGSTLPPNFATGTSAAPSAGSLANPIQLTSEQPANMPASWAQYNGSGKDSLSVQNSLDNLNYFTLITMSEYSRESWVSVGKLAMNCSVKMPLSMTMVDEQSIAYDVTPLTLAGMGWDAWQRAMPSEKGDDSSKAGYTGKAFLAQLAATGNYDMAELLKSGAKSFGTLGSGLPDTVAVASGYQINDFLTVMFKNPEYKRRDFIWKIAPRTQQESQNLRTIRNTIMNNQAASYGKGSAGFLKWPSIFQLSFQHTSGADLEGFTFAMKPAVLTRASFNFAPNGVYVPFGTTKAPSSVEIRMSFMELEYWMSGDYGNDKYVHPTLTPIDTTAPAPATKNLAGQDGYWPATGPGSDNPDRTLTPNDKAALSGWARGWFGTNVNPQ